MATTQVPAWANHSDPHAAKCLRAVAKGRQAHYPSMAALVRAVVGNDCPHPLGDSSRADSPKAKAWLKQVGYKVRQVTRDADLGVGRGNRYEDAAPTLRDGAQVVAKRKGSAAQQKQAGADKPKAAKPAAKRTRKAKTAA